MKKRLFLLCSLVIALALVISSISFGFVNTTVDKEIVKFKIMGPDNYVAEASYTKDLPWVKEWEKRMNVKLEYELAAPGQNYTTMAETRLASGTNLPDIMLLPGSYNFSQCWNLAKRKLIVPISYLIKMYAPNIKRVYEVEYPYFTSVNTCPDGKLYWLTDLYVSAGEDIWTFLFREDWLKSAGLGRLPETTDEFYDTVKKIKEKDPNGNGKKDEVLNGGFGDYKYLLLQAFGIKHTGDNYESDSSGKLSPIAIDPRYKQFLMYMNKLYKDGLLDPEFTNMPWEKFTAKVSQNIAIAFPQYPFNSSSYEKMVNGATGVKYSPMKALKGPNGDYGVPYSYSNPTHYRVAITKACKNQKRAIQFLDYVYSREGQTLTMYGIEGVDYNVVNGKIVIADKLKAAIAKDGWKATYSRGQNWNFTVRYWNKTFEQNVEDFQIRSEYVNTIKDLLTIAQKVKPQYYLPPSENDQKMLKNLEPDLNTFTSEKQMAFILGRESFDKWDDYVKKVKQMNIDKVTEIYQKNYDRFLKLGVKAK